MIQIFNYASLGNKDHGWLNARHHFSFADYHNPSRLHFGTLRVINDDIIQAGKGFAPHPHQNMEIITYVRSGAITHKDSMGNVGRTAAGDVQVMSAGTGVTHSEFNLEQEATSLYQIWIIPNEKNVEPRWDAMQFPKEFVGDKLQLLVSGQAEHKNSNALFIHQDAAIYGGVIKKDTKIMQTIKHQAYILVARGKVTIDNNHLTKGDGAQITDTNLIKIQADEDAEILVIDVPYTNSLSKQH